MPDERVRILAIDDSPGDQQLLRLMFEEAAPEVDLAVVGSVGDAEARLADGPTRAALPHLVLIDARLPQDGARRLLTLLDRDDLGRVQRAVVAATYPRHLDALAVRRGAWPCLLKPKGLDEYLAFVADSIAIARLAFVVLLAAMLLRGVAVG